ncbi:hypothetical protein SLOPH_2468 [Spraguea lophii 42_110]|uniref:Uncharacterized protein n=1 Tax=Spraguea lophii (strain 42_110) TaxID=1358809 RepID=S7XFE1_SPRLO|nr:hypothetical protein SLOPH_2468 [Spraguea lophii 42_110]
MNKNIEVVISSDEFSDVENGFFDKEIEIKPSTAPDWFDKKVPIRREYKRKNKIYKYKVDRKVYSVNNNIKKIIPIINFEEDTNKESTHDDNTITSKNKSKKNTCILLDSQNNIYIDEKGYKIRNFRITDMCLIKDKIVMISNKSGIMQEMDIYTKEVVSIRKNTSENGYKKIVAYDNIYLLSDKLYVLDIENYEITNILEIGNALDFTIKDNRIFILYKDKIVEYLDYKINNIVEINGFGIEKIFYLQNKIYVAQKNELMVFKDSLKKLKGFRRIKGTVKNMVDINGLIFLHTEELNSLRVIEDDKLIDYIPNSKTKFPIIHGIENINGEVVFSHTKYISSIKIYN